MKRRVIIELRHNKSLQKSFEAQSNKESKKEVKLSSSAIPKIEGLEIDLDFGAIALPAESLIQPKDVDDPTVEFYDSNYISKFTYDLDQSTYIVRGEVNDKDISAIDKSSETNKNIVGIYADLPIRSFAVCPGPMAIGNDRDVERLLGVPALRACNAKGQGVRVAIVDGGINMEYLRSMGKDPNFDAASSWKPASTRSGRDVGEMPADHGTMCAYDVCIAAPECTLIDIALLQTRNTGETVMEPYLSDAIVAYRHLIDLQQNIEIRPGQNKSLVVNNSWGMYRSDWDFPVGHSGNYSDNPGHPFNVIVRSLERNGADILFAAGNCGEDCPSPYCEGETTRAIYGANSSPFVLSVAGVDTTKTRLGYSSIGPGRLHYRKPDVSGYSHFEGSGVYAADGGTSAACPVVAGVVAAVRTKRPYSEFNSISSPGAIRNLIRTTCEDLGSSGYDYRTGYGVVDAQAITRKICLPEIEIVDWCKKYPGLCRPPFEVIDICKRWPQLCNFCERFPYLCSEIPKIPDDIIPEGPIPGPFPFPPGPIPRPFPLPPGPIPRPSPFLTGNYPAHKSWSRMSNYSYEKTINDITGWMNFFSEEQLEVLNYIFGQMMVETNSHAQHAKVRKDSDCVCGKQ